jgi:hypothetical protein
MPNGFNRRDPWPADQARLATDETQLPAYYFAVSASDREALWAGVAKPVGDDERLLARFNHALRHELNRVIYNARFNPIDYVTKADAELVLDFNIRRSGLTIQNCSIDPVTIGFNGLSGYVLAGRACYKFENPAPVNPIFISPSYPGQKLTIIEEIT